MPKEGVIVHRCFRPELGQKLPPRKLPKLKKGQKRKNTRICRCADFITDPKAEELVNDGAAEWMEIGTSLVILGAGAKKTPRAATIEEEHIEYAYLSNRTFKEIRDVQKAYAEHRFKDIVEKDESIARIEEYGILTLLARIQTGRLYHTLLSEPEGGRENDWGRPIFSQTDDERTEGGIGVDISSKPDMIVTEAKQ